MPQRRNWLRANISAAGLTFLNSSTSFAESLSDDDSVVPDGSSAQSVEAELQSGNTIKPAIFPIDAAHSWLGPLYSLKNKFSDSFGLAFSADYSAMFQHASFTQSGDDTASGQVFRILGTWLQTGTPEGNMGVLVWKTETRTSMFGNPTPRDMGFDTGSALSTANYKKLNYWGVTDLYWRQSIRGGNFGLVGQAFLTDNTYVMAGVHDANGKDGKPDFASFWEARELYSWVEYGFRSDRDIGSKINSHVHLWHQDRRAEEFTDESWGVTYTHSYVTPKDSVAFIRAGYSEGNAAQMRRFVGVGLTHTIAGRDTLGIATGWGSPPDKSLRDQVTSEVFYRIQLTQNFTFTPSLQFTYKPSLTLEEDRVFIPGLRIRMVF